MRLITSRWAGRLDKGVRPAISDSVSTSGEPSTESPEASEYSDEDNSDGKGGRSPVVSSATSRESFEALFLTTIHG